MAGPNDLLFGKTGASPAGMKAEELTRLSLSVYTYELVVDPTDPARAFPVLIGHVPNDNQSLRRVTLTLFDGSKAVPHVWHVQACIRRAATAKVERIGPPIMVGGAGVFPPGRRVPLLGPLRVSGDKAQGDAEIEVNRDDLIYVSLTPTNPAAEFWYALWQADIYYGG